MRVAVHLSSSNESLRHYTEQRLLSCLGQIERVLATVTACVARLPGGRHRCRMLAQPVSQPPVLVEEEDRDIYAAIDRAAEGLAGAVEVAMQRAATTPMTTTALGEPIGPAVLRRPLLAITGPTDNTGGVSEAAGRR